MGMTFGIGLDFKPKFALNSIRTLKHLSRRELAEKSGVNEMTIVALESGKNNPNDAKLSTLIKLATALNCKVRDFYPCEKRI